MMELIGMRSLENQSHWEFNLNGGGGQFQTVLNAPLSFRISLKPEFIWSFYVNEIARFCL